MQLVGSRASLQVIFENRVDRSQRIPPNDLCTFFVNLAPVKDSDPIDTFGLTVILDREGR
jgi:hypothetical protein